MPEINVGDEMYIPPVKDLKTVSLALQKLADLWSRDKINDKQLAMWLIQLPAEIDEYERRMGRRDK